MKHNSWDLDLATVKSQQMGKTYLTSSSCFHEVVRANVSLWKRGAISDFSFRVTTPPASGT